MKTFALCLFVFVVATGLFLSACASFSYSSSTQSPKSLTLEQETAEGVRGVSITRTGTDVIARFNGYEFLFSNESDWSGELSMHEADLVIGPYIVTFNQRGGFVNKQGYQDFVYVQYSDGKSSYAGGYNVRPGLLLKESCRPWKFPVSERK